MKERLKNPIQPATTDNDTSPPTCLASPAGSNAHQEALPSSSPLLHRNNNHAPPGHPGSPREGSSGGVIREGAGAGERGRVDGGGGGGVGGKEGWGGVPGKRHIDFEVHLVNSQVKRNKRRSSPIAAYASVSQDEMDPSFSSILRALPGGFFDML